MKILFMADIVAPCSPAKCRINNKSGVGELPGCPADPRETRAAVEVEALAGLGDLDGLDEFVVRIDLVGLARLEAAIPVFETLAVEHQRGRGAFRGVVHVRGHETFRVELP